LTLEQMMRMSTLLDEAVERDSVGRQRWFDELPFEDQDLLVALREVP